MGTPAVFSVFFIDIMHFSALTGKNPVRMLLLVHHNICPLFLCQALSYYVADTGKWCYNNFC